MMGEEWQQNWRSVLVQPKTIFDILNRNLLDLQQNYNYCLPNLRGSRALLLGSDYSGESPNSQYSVYSFLLSTFEAWSTWEPKRLEIRKKFFSDSRRMSFKQLGDAQKYRALPTFLEAANSLEGLSFTVAINKQTEFFVGDTPLSLNNPEFENFLKWKKGVLQKAALIVHFLGFLVAGLGTQWQNIFWFTDEDGIAANNQRVKELSNLFAWISSQYLNHSLGHLRCGTSRCDNGSRQIEDFLAIPDLIAGSISEQLTVKRKDSIELSEVFWIHRPDYQDKTKNIMWWFSDSQKPLKRLFCVINPSGDGSSHLISWYHFYNQMD